MALNKNQIRLKKGDMVVVLAGKDRGKKGKILKTLPKKEAVLVEKINLVKRHMKPNPKNPQGGIIEKEAPLHISNVQVFSPKTNKGVRIKYKVEGDAKIRVDQEGNPI